LTTPIAAAIIRGCANGAVAGLNPSNDQKTEDAKQNECFG